MFRILVTAVLSAFLALVLTETVLERPYAQAKSGAKTALSALRPSVDTPDQSAQACAYPRIDTLAPGSSIIVGHAYGAPNRQNQFIAPRLEEVIRTQARNLSSVIFSGDVLENPSEARWARLEALSAETGVTFHIAPGNHDVGHGDNALRDIWNRTGFRLPDAAMASFEVSGFSVFLEDSIKTDWHMSRRVMEDLKTAASDLPRLLVRHNVAVRDMYRVANSRAGLKGDLPGASDLVGALPAGLTVVSGDSGAFSGLPRLACLHRDTVTFVANGIGEVPGDTVLVLRDGAVFRLSL